MDTLIIMTKTKFVKYAKKNNWKPSIIQDIQYNINGHYWIVKSIKDFNIKVVLVALEQKQAITSYDVYNISESIIDFGLDATLFAVNHKKAEDSWDVYRIAKAKFNEGITQ